MTSNNFFLSNSNSNGSHHRSGDGTISSSNFFRYQHRRSGFINAGTPSCKDVCYSTKDKERFNVLFTSNSEIISYSSFDVNDFYSWFDNLSVCPRSLKTTYGRRGRYYRIELATNWGDPQRMVFITGDGESKKEQLYNILVKVFCGEVVSQMMNPETTVDGDLEQEFTKASNTIITSDAIVDSVSVDAGNQPVISDLSSTEPLHQMPSISDRFQILKVGTITTTSDELATVVIPRDLFSIKDGSQSANLLLFRNFVYSEMELEFKIVVNAPKFTQGRIIASWFPDHHDQLDEQYAEASSLLQRPHVMIDLNLKNQAELRIPQLYRRSFVRNYLHESASGGLPYAQMCCLQIYVLSSLRTGAGQPEKIPFNVQYRFLKLNMTGLSFGVTLQMDKIVGGVVELAGDVYPPIKAAERYLKRAGVFGNQDKPYSDESGVVIPAPRKNFSSGNGISDSIPLVFDRMSTITLLPDYLNGSDPKTIFDICKIPGLKAKFTWKTSHEANTLLWSLPVTPCFHNVELKTKFESRPIPLDYISSGYAFWRGTLKYEFHFISTSFHTGTIQIQISFNRIGDDMYDNTNVYTKMFDLGEQKVVEITAPFIYDTPWRRCHSNVQPPIYPSAAGTNEYISKVVPYPMCSEFVTNTRISVRVINPLIPLENVSKEVECLVFLSAGSDFELRSVVPNCFTYPIDLVKPEIDFTGTRKRYLTQLPIYNDNGIPENVDPGTTVARLSSVFHTNSRFLRTQLNLPVGLEVKSQSEDQTADFSAGRTFRHFHSTDDDTNIKNLLRRFYSIGVFKVQSRIQNKVTTFISAGGKKTMCDGVSAYWHPVFLPNHLNNTMTTDNPISSPLCVLGTLFRHWRGSMRYTFVISGAPITSPIKFSYIPNIGTIYSGNKFHPRKVTMDDDQASDRTLTDWNGEFSSLGYATEILVPSVNSSISITVPFDNMFNRCVNATRMKMRGSDKNFDRIFAREECTMFSGHIVIVCEQDVQLEVFQSVGDDFEMMDFVGTLKYTQGLVMGFPDSYYAYAGANNARTSSDNIVKGGKIESLRISVDENGKFPALKPEQKKFYDSSTYNIMRVKELDFRNKHHSGNITGVVSQGPIKNAKQTLKNLSRLDVDGLETFLKHIEGVGDCVTAGSAVVANSADAISSSIGIISDNFENSSERLLSGVEKMVDNTNQITRDFAKRSDSLDKHIGKISENSTRITNEFGETSKQLMNLITPIMTKLNKILPENKRGIFDSFTTDFVFDLILLIRNFDFTNFGIIFLRYVSKIFGIGFEKIMHWGTELSSLIKNKFASFVTQQESTSAVGGSLFGFFVAMISSICKFTLNTKSKNFDYGSKSADFLFDVRNVSYVNQIITLVERIFKTFSSAIVFCQKKKQVDPTMREYFQEKRVELTLFMESVDELTNPANSRIMNRADMKAKAFATYLTALSLQKKLAFCAGNSSASTLMKYVYRMIKFIEEHWARFSCSPVRIEPQVYCFTGPPGCGKSFYSEYFAAELMSAIGYKMLGGNPVFTRVNGRKHWDGYTDQPIILFDDWLNLSAPEHVSEQIADLYQLKSTCELIPPQASIDEKGTRANPRVIILLTNNAFPTNVLTANCPHIDAIYRRRDKMIYVRRKAAYQNKNLSEMTEDESKNFSQMEFALGFSDRPLTPVEQDRLEWLSHPDFLKKMVDDFIIQNKRQEDLARRKLQTFCRDLPSAVREMADPIANYNYRTMLVKNEYEDVDEMIPSKRLIKEMDGILEMVNGIFDSGETIVEEQGFSKNFLKKIVERKKDEVKIMDCPVREKLNEMSISDKEKRNKHYELQAFGEIDSELKFLIKLLPDKYSAMFAKERARRLNLICGDYDMSPVDLLSLTEECFMYHLDSSLIQHNKKFPHHKISIPEPDELSLVIKWFKTYSEKFENQWNCKNRFEVIEYIKMFYFDKREEILDEIVFNFPVFDFKPIKNFAIDENYQVDVIDGSKMNELLRTRDCEFTFKPEGMRTYHSCEFDGKFKDFDFTLRIVDFICLDYEWELNVESEFRMRCVDGEFINNTFMWKDDPMGAYDERHNIKQHKNKGSYSFDMSIINDRTNLFQKRTIHERKNLAKQLIIRASEDRELANMVHLNNIELFDGRRVKFLPQESLTSKNDLISEAIITCHHCKQKKILQFGNRQHHICVECKEAQTHCDYCGDFGAECGIYLKPFLVYLKSLSLRKMGQSIKDILTGLWFSFPSWLRTCLEMALCAGLLGFGYLVGFVGGCVLLSKAITQAPIYSRFSRENFDAMMTQRENYVDELSCKHHLLINISGFDYENYLWRQIDDDVVIPLYPCKKNCCLFEDNMRARYMAFCEMYEQRQMRLIGACYTLTTESMTSENIAKYYASVPPFCRPSGVPFPTDSDLFVVESRKKYTQIVNKIINGCLGGMGINPTSSILKILGGCVAAILAAVVAVKGIVGIFGYVKNKFSSSEEQAKYEIHGRPFYKARSSTKTNTKIAPVTTQSDSQFFISLYKKMFKNFLVFKIFDVDNNLQMEMLTIGAKNRLVLMPKHYYHGLRDLPLGWKIKLLRPFYPEICCGYVFDPYDFQIADEADLAVFNCPRYMNDFVNITGYFAHEVDFKSVLPRECLFVRGPTRGMSQPMTHNVSLKSNLQKRIKLTDSSIDELQGVLVYNYSEQGACGSILIRKDSQRPIIGMHVAGTTLGSFKTEGYATILTQEMFYDIQFEQSLVVENKSNDLEDNVAEASILFPDKVQVQALSVWPKKVHLPTKSKIIPSLLHEYDGPPLTQPCFLTRNDPGYVHDISPLVAGCSKHGVLTENFKTSDLEFVKSALYTAKYEYSLPLIVNPRKLTIAQAIRGFSIDGYDKMKLDTSAGFPFVYEQKKAKQDYISVTDEQEVEKRRVFITGWVLEHIEETEKLRCKGIIPCLPYIDELKDERRKPEKANKLGGTRVFCMSPLSNTIATRRNFLHFAAMYKQNRLTLQHAVGISRDGMEWGIMANSLLDNGTKIVTLDYSNFGPGYNAGVCAAAHDIISNWTKKYVADVNHAELEVLGEEHFNSLHIMSDLVYRQLSGGPSGDALTVIKNGLVNELYIMLAWFYLFPRDSSCGTVGMFDAFFENVVLYTYGDDAIMSVSDEICEWFNGETICKFFANYGIVATDAEKSGTMVKWRSLTESTFLKSGFKPHPQHLHQWLAPLDLDSVTETPRWVFENPNMHEATYQNCDQALHLVYGHGEGVFNTFKKKLNDSMAEFGIKPLLITWKELDKIFFPSFYV